jgi:hypothetical protein
LDSCEGRKYIEVYKNEVWERKFESKRDEFDRRMCPRSISLALFTQYCYDHYITDNEMGET